MLLAKGVDSVLAVMLVKQLHRLCLCASMFLATCLCVAETLVCIREDHGVHLGSVVVACCELTFAHKCQRTQQEPDVAAVEGSTQVFVGETFLPMMPHHSMGEVIQPVG